MDKCEWAQDLWEDYFSWETNCGNFFTFDDGGPIENKFEYCPYCGRPLFVDIGD